MNMRRAPTSCQTMDVKEEKEAEEEARGEREGEVRQEREVKRRRRFIDDLSESREVYGITF